MIDPDSYTSIHSPYDSSNPLISAESDNINLRKDSAMETNSEGGYGFFNSIWYWLCNILTEFGLINKEAKLVILGLDNAGKTTLLGTLCSGRIRSTKPTIRPHSEELVMDKITFCAWDLGGHEGARVLWSEYSHDAGIIVFIVDSSNPKRFEEARQELQKVLRFAPNIPVLVLGNKIDKREAVSEAILREELGLPHHLTTGKERSSSVTSLKENNIRPIEVFMCSIVCKTGYKEGFQWVAQYI